MRVRGYYQFTHSPLPPSGTSPAWGGRISCAYLVVGCGKSLIYRIIIILNLFSSLLASELVLSFDNPLPISEGMREVVRLFTPTLSLPVGEGTRVGVLLIPFPSLSQRGRGKSFYCQVKTDLHFLKTCFLKNRSAEIFCASGVIS